MSKRKLLDCTTESLDKRPLTALDRSMTCIRTGCGVPIDMTTEMATDVSIMKAIRLLGCLHKLGERYPAAEESVNCCNIRVLLTTYILMPSSTLQKFIMKKLRAEAWCGVSRIIVPYGIVKIGSRAFYNCSQLTHITFPDSVKEFGTSTFGCCSKLTHVNIPNGVTKIPCSMFGHCESLISVDIPNSIKSIGSHVFRWCVKLNNINIPTSVKEIGERTFWGCQSIISISIPDSVKRIGCQMFDACHSLETVSIPKDVQIIGNFKNSCLPTDGLFLRCMKLNSIQIPNIHRIGCNMFRGCRALKNVVIPESVHSILHHAFAYSGLTSIYIPSSVTYLGDRVFQGCKNLNSISIPRHLLGDLKHVSVGLVENDSKIIIR